MRKIVLIGIGIVMSLVSLAQPATEINWRFTIVDPAREPLAGATVSLLRSDSSVFKQVISDSLGFVQFTVSGNLSLTGRISRIGFQTQYLSLGNDADRAARTIVLQPSEATLSNVVVTAKKPLVQFLTDRTVVNVDASITNAGTSVMEVLEKSPGVTVDKDGNISLKGKPGVQIMIDGKPTMLAGSDLQNLLSGMNSSQIETIELIDNPSAKYDAAGNAGIINIRTKKNKQKGFNGSVTAAFGQGRLPKNNNNLQFNYRNGKFNYFLTYSVNLNRQFMDMYALRTYYDLDNKVTSLLEQPYYTRSRGNTHVLRTGADYYLSNRTTLGLALSGMSLHRYNTGEATAIWMNEQHQTDSTIYTSSLNTSRMRQGGINLNMRHNFDSKRELSADFDLIHYRIRSAQHFENRFGTLSGLPDDASEGDIPSTLRILTGKIDYTQRFDKWTWETGWKSSRVSTDNLAQYYTWENNGWADDLNKSNHFLYTENIHALYTNAQATLGKWSLQGGLRYEYTGYDARQLGNARVKDSSFSRRYGNLFPSVFVTWQADSINSFTLRAGRRIDRPPFQKLNPFVFIINKYTYQQGNPYFKPQFTWNFELSHLYKEVLSTTFSYNLIRDYISQVFYADTSTGLIVYTEGNIGQMQNYSLTMSTQLSPTPWWSFNLQGTANHKIIEAQLWRKYRARITQASFSLNSQFKLGKGWGAELSGFYITRAQNDIQEVLRPTGQLAVGFSKQVLRNKGTLRLTVRDIFYTQAMAGLTDFLQTKEYFKLQRDTRVATLSFSWRFGKAMKQTARRNTGGASSEIERVGTVN